jgi:hypothetical protein
LTGDSVLHLHENSATGTFITAQDEGLQYTDPEKDLDQSFTYKLQSEEHRRLFKVAYGKACGLGYGSEATNSNLIVNGIVTETATAKACERICAGKLNCMSWEFVLLSSKCYLYKSAPVCTLALGESCSVLDGGDANIIITENAPHTCGFINNWHLQRMHKCNISESNKLESGGYLVGYNNYKVCMHACRKSYPNCLSWQFHQNSNGICLLYNVLPSVSSMAVAKD